MFWMDQELTMNLMEALVQKEVIEAIKNGERGFITKMAKPIKK